MQAAIGLSQLCLRKRTFKDSAAKARFVPLFRPSPQVELIHTLRDKPLFRCVCAKVGFGDAYIKYLFQPDR